MKYIFCPQCGNKLMDKLAGDEGMVSICYIENIWRASYEKRYCKVLDFCYNIIRKDNRHRVVDLMRKD